MVTALLTTRYLFQPDLILFSAIFSKQVDGSKRFFATGGFGIRPIFFNPSPRLTEVSAEHR